MSFPRILPDYSNFPGVILNSFQAWRKNGFHQSHVLSKIAFKFFSLLAQPLCFSFYRNISVILVVFLVVISGSKKNFSSKSCQFYRRFVVLASCYLLELFQLSDILFLPIRSMSGIVFRFFSPEAIITEEFFVLTFQLSYPITPAHLSSIL